MPLISRPRELISLHSGGTYDFPSRDAGKTWKLSIDGVEMTVINTVAQQPKSPKTFHTGMADVGYFRSLDGGLSTQQVNKGISNNVKCIAVAPSQPQRVYATSTSDWEWKANQLFISDDAGASWRRSAMKGLPDMNTRRCETVAVNPKEANSVWLTVSGDVKANEGGVYFSTDGGDNWTWAGEGLPAGEGFFRKDYWVSGPELAVSGDGSVVATSDDRGLMARRGANETRWTMLKTPAGGPNCVASDAQRAGRFYVACREGGLWRSDDSGATWQNLVQGDVSWVCADTGKANRVVANTPVGVIVSADAGKTWRDMSRALPYRHPRNVVCFAGENVVVGTGGNGVFYAPLSSLSGKATERGRGVLSTQNLVSLVRNGDMTKGIATPDDWSLGQWKQGEISLSRDTQTFASAPAALRLQTQGKATGMAQQSLQPVAHGKISVSGKIKVAGNLETAQVAIQVFDRDWKQIDWKTIRDADQTATGWQSFSSEITVRDDAAYALIGATLSGDGSLWLDDVQVVAQGEAKADAPSEVAALPVKIAATDKRVRFIGRFDNSGETPRSAWPASTLEVRFRGTDLNAHLQGNSQTRWQIFVDGKPTQKIALADQPALYRVATGLKAGEHTVRLVQATEAFFGTTRVLGFEMNKGAQLLAAKPAARRIEIIGDSISAGYGNEAAGKDEKFSPDTENAAFTYGVLAARELNADYTVLAWSGKKMWPDNTMPELYDRAIPTEEKSVWNFAAPAPDAVIINLATNDFWGKNPDEAGWTGAYETFAKRVRARYPKAHLYFATGPMMYGDSLTALRGYLNKVIANLKAQGENRVHLLEFATQDGNNGFGADWHPSLKTHQIMAQHLTATLRRDLKW